MGKFLVIGAAILIAGVAGTAAFAADSKAPRHAGPTAPRSEQAVSKGKPAIHRHSTHARPHRSRGHVAHGRHGIHRK